ncbi:DUF2934 domain-containing protein [Bradyrhizobium sp. Lot33]
MPDRAVGRNGPLLSGARQAMADPNDHEIRVRAHRLWEAAGRPEGRDEEFWRRAELELRTEAEQLDKLKEPPNNLPG